MRKWTTALRDLLHRAGDAVLAGLFLLVAVPLLLPPADRVIALFGALGRWVLPRVPTGRRVARNLARIRPGLGAPAVRALQAEVGEQFGRVLAEYIRMPDLVTRRDRRQVEGLAHLEAARAAGRGVVIASAHIGNWEQIRLAAADAGIPVALIYRAFNNRTFDAITRWHIPLAGMPVLHKGRAGMREMLAHLKRGGVILVLMDQHASGGAMLPFLGHPAETATAIPALCRRTGAALVPARAIRQADGLSFRVSFEPPILPGDPVAMTAAVNERIGAWIEETPGQWFWLHRRWRHRVDGDGEPDGSESVNEWPPAFR